MGFPFDFAQGHEPAERQPMITTTEVQPQGRDTGAMAKTRDAGAGRDDRGADL